MVGQCRVELLPRRARFYGQLAGTAGFPDPWSPSAVLSRDIRLTEAALCH
jgi:hypothetical protein